MFSRASIRKNGLLQMSCPPSAACRWGFCTSRSAANRWTRWQTCTALRKTSGTFCTSCFPRKCVPACLLCAAGLPLPMASCAGRCRGTPILAAHSGTVLVSGWNDSYGNQVLLDNGAGLSTRYAHMMQTAVIAGEAVTAGQVIGYVGNTGDSTGFHLHFEVMQGGVMVDPLSLVS